jgi:hypothetical protein
MPGLTTAFALAMATNRVLVAIWPELLLSGALVTSQLDHLLLDENAVVFDQCPWPGVQVRLATDIITNDSTQENYLCRVAMATCQW